MKEIADIYGITKPLTFHIARHTFATTVTLTNGVPIESISNVGSCKTYYNADLCKGGGEQIGWGYGNA